MLFGEDYLKFKDYLVEGWFVFVRGSVEQRRFRDDPNDVEFKVKGVELLADVRDKMVGRLRLALDMVSMNEKRLNELTSLVANHPGPVGLTLDISDRESNMTMSSRTKRVAISDEFLEGLEALTSEGGMGWRIEIKR